jgi:DNA uptake protein ComE-like DNA-binding protein
MTTRILRLHLAIAMLLLSLGLPLAADDQPAPKGKAPKAAATPAAKAKGKLKPVDLNSATKNELAFMLEIPEELAAKIVAGRPYRTKAHLYTRNIVSAEVYARIKGRVIAVQPKPVR